MSKPHASVDECLLLIRLKREKAVAAMREILVSACLPKHGYANVLIILEYLTDMVYCLEMMLKVLSGDWKTHKVGSMYEKIFGAPHANKALMDEITIALQDQKYLFEPKEGLLSQVGEIERLYDRLETRLSENHEKFQVSYQIPAPRSLMIYLRDNVTRFYSSEAGPTLVFEKGEATPNALAKYKADWARYCEELQAGMHNEAQEMRDYLDRLINDGGSLVFYNGTGAVI